MYKLFTQKNVLILLVLVIGATMLISCAKKAQVEKDEIAYYTCSMHPEIKENEPGKCSICGMDLTPVMKSAVADSQKVETPQE